MFVDEGIIHVLNSSLGVAAGGAPSPKSQYYLALGTANREWDGSETAGDGTADGGAGGKTPIHMLASEFETYTETTRQDWTPLVLATVDSIQLDDVGDEALFTIGDLAGGDVTIYNAFIISVSGKDGSSDATATLLAGNKFATPRTLYEGDKFYVGAILSGVDGTA